MKKRIPIFLKLLNFLLPTAKKMNSLSRMPPSLYILVETLLFCAPVAAITLVLIDHNNILQTPGWKIFLLFFLLASWIMFFVNLHSYGPSGILLLAKERYILKKMEAAWVWNQFANARQLAKMLLATTDEICYPGFSNYSVFLRALCLYVLAYERDVNDPKMWQGIEEVRLILRTTNLYKNDIMDVDTFLRITE